MKPFEAVVQSQTLEPLGRPATWVSWINKQPSFKPGQAVLIYDDRLHSLADAVLPIQIRPERLLLELPQTASFSPGDRFKLWGPLGTSFIPPEISTKWLLLAPNADPGRLLPLVEAGLEAGASVAVWSDQPIANIPPMVELLASPSDGLKWADYIAIDLGDSDTFEAPSLSAQDLKASDAIIIEVLCTPPMPCGFGGCGLCAVKGKRGWHLACLDGPVFNWNELDL
jgi:hypothetical protein